MNLIAGGSIIKPKEWKQPYPFQYSTYERVKYVNQLPYSLVFSTDGTKMYYGSDGTAIYQWNLSTAWDISTASFFQLFSFSEVGSQAASIVFNATGTIGYVSGSSSSLANLFQYTFATPFDITDAVYTGNSINITNASAKVFQTFISSDGLHFISYSDNNSTVYSYSLSIAWDISSATYVSNMYLLSSGITVKQDGTKLYFEDEATDSVQEYTMSTPWLLSSATYTTRSYRYLDSDFPVFIDNGNHIVHVDTSSLELHSIKLQTPYDINSGIYCDVEEVYQSTEGFLMQISFNSDGTILYLPDVTDLVFYVYILSTPWEISSMTFSYTASIGGAAGYGSCFSYDGNHVYVNHGTSIDQYELDTPWDISSITDNNLDMDTLIHTSSGNPYGVWISTDGTKFYICDPSYNEIHQFTLSTPYNVSTAAHYVTIDLSAYNSYVISIQISVDGTQMIASGNGIVHQFDLITPFDISTWSNPVNILDSISYDDDYVFMSPDGSKCYSHNNRFYSMKQWNAVNRI